MPRTNHVRRWNGYEEEGVKAFDDLIRGSFLAMAPDTFVHPFRMVFLQGYRKAFQRGYFEGAADRVEAMNVTLDMPFDPEPVCFEPKCKFVGIHHTGQHTLKVNP